MQQSSTATGEGLQEHGTRKLAKSASDTRRDNSSIMTSMRKLFRFGSQKAEQEDELQQLAHSAIARRGHARGQKAVKAAQASLVDSPKKERTSDPRTVLSDRSSLFSDRSSIMTDRSSAVTDRSSVTTDRSSIAFDRPSVGERASAGSSTLPPVPHTPPPSTPPHHQASFGRTSASASPAPATLQKSPSTAKRFGSFMKRIMNSGGSNSNPSSPAPKAAEHQQLTHSGARKDGQQGQRSSGRAAPATPPHNAPIMSPGLATFNAFHILPAAEPAGAPQQQHAAASANVSAAPAPRPQQQQQHHEHHHHHDVPLPPPSANEAKRLARDGNLLAVCDELPAEMDRPQWRVEDYTLQQKLHSGYASAVYKAICRHSGMTVALKVYQPEKLHVISQHQLYREARLQSQMSHPNIVKLYAAFRHGNNVILVQEFADGGDLLQLLMRHGTRLSERRAMALVVLPLLRSMFYLHGRNIVHRDIKLENILFTGKELTLKLADFGLCLNLAEERSVTRAGTLDYMAPEVLRCPQKHKPNDNKERLDLAYTAAVDIWALGVVTYELLNGCPPFTCHDKKETERRIQSGMLPEFVVDASELAQDFVYACFASSADDRPSAWQLLRSPWVKTISRPSARNLMQLVSQTAAADAAPVVASPSTVSPPKAAAAPAAAATPRQQDSVLPGQPMPLASAPVTMVPEAAAAAAASSSAEGEQGHLNGHGAAAAAAAAAGFKDADGAEAVATAGSSDTDPAAAQARCNNAHGRSLTPSQPAHATAAGAASFASNTSITAATASVSQNLFRKLSHEQRMNKLTSLAERVSSNSEVLVASGAAGAGSGSEPLTAEASLADARVSSGTPEGSSHGVQKRSTPGGSGRMSDKLKELFRTKAVARRPGATGSNSSTSSNDTVSDEIAQLLQDLWKEKQRDRTTRRPCDAGEGREGSASTPRREASSVTASGRISTSSSFHTLDAAAGSTLSPMAVVASSSAQHKPQSSAAMAVAPVAGGEAAAVKSPRRAHFQEPAPRDAAGTGADGDEDPEAELELLGAMSRNRKLTKSFSDPARRPR